jgi:hypothetical protein
MPLIVAGIAAELAHLAGSLRQAWAPSASLGQRVTAVAMGGGVLVLLGWTAQMTAAGLFSDLPDTVNAKRELLRQRGAAYAWIVQHTPAGAAVLAANDAQVTLYTGRPSCRVPGVPRWLYEGDRERFLLKPLLEAPRFMRERSLDYLLVTSGDYERDLTDSERALVEARLRTTPELELAWERQGVAVYRLRGAVSGSRMLVPGP